MNPPLDSRLGLLVLCALPWVCHAQYPEIVKLTKHGATMTLSVDDSRPVAYAMQALVHEHGFRLAYEDPRYEAPEDVFGSHGIVIPRGGAFSFDYPASAAVTEILDRLTAAAARAVPAARFRIVNEAGLLHLVPRANPSVLDTLITLEPKPRTADVLIEAICAEVSRESGVRLWGPPLPLVGVTTIPERTYAFGAKRVKARTVLANALRTVMADGGSDLSWMLFYDPEGPERGYVLNLVVIPGPRR